MKTSSQRLPHATVLLLILGLSLDSARADALDNWSAGLTATNPVGYIGSLFLGVTYGNGRYVAVGEYASSDNALIETSEDGINWTMRTAYDFSILDLFDVTCGNGMFVAVGWDAFSGHDIYHSTNGINWTSHTTTIGQFYRVTYGGGVFVAVGDGVLLNSSGNTTENIYFSYDGFNWFPTDSGAPANDVRAINDVAYGAGVFVAVDGGNFYVSDDGELWSRFANSRAGNRVSFCNGLFIVPAGAGTNLVSANGIIWSLLTNGTGSTFGRVVYGNGIYLAQVGSTVYSSTDGTNWVHRNLQPPSNVSLRAITMGPRNAVLVGYAYPPTPLTPVAYISDPFVGIGITPGSPLQLSISGLEGRSYRIESVETLGTGWQARATFSLTNGPASWTDDSATNASQFYRAVLLP